MFYRMITEARDRWYASPDCTVGPVIEYIVQKGELRGPQIEAIKTYLFLEPAARTDLWPLFFAAAHLII